MTEKKMVEKVLEVRGNISGEVIAAAQVLMKWNSERIAAVRAAEPNKDLFSMSILNAPDETVLVVCGPEHSHCLKHWFARHHKHEGDGDVTHDVPHEPGKSA